MTAHAESPPGRGAARGHRTLRYVAIALLVANIVTVLALWLHRRHVVSTGRAERSRVVDRGPRLSVVKVEVSSADRQITLPAESRAFEQTTLYARVNGYLREIRVERGQPVKAGDVVAVVESPETQQAVIAARSEAETAQRNAERARALAPGVVSQQDLDTALNVARTARANLQRALAEHGYTSLRAPFDGIVTVRYADPGALLQAATPLVDIANPDRLRIFVYVGQDAAPFVHPADAVTLWQDELPARRIPTTVTRTSGALDPRTRTMLCEIELDNRPWGILPGSFVHAELHLRVPSSPVVPNEALAVRDGKTAVVVVEGEKARLVPVDLGPSDGKTTRIMRGLAGGETIGFNVPVEIGDGATVQPVYTSPR